MSTFPIGSTVVIQNLVNGSQFNGKRGVVQTECISGRYKLTLLYNNKSLGIKPTNMKLVEAEVLSKSDTKNIAEGLGTRPKNGCAACGNTNRKLQQCTCLLCVKLKGMAYPVFYCNNNGKCQKANEEEHMRQQDLLYGMISMILEAKKKEWEGKDACRLHDGDEALFKDHPPRKECPICFLPMPIAALQYFYQSCCGKDICHGCMHQVNIRSGEDCLCPFCRAPFLGVEDQQEGVERMKKRMDLNDCEAFRVQGTYYAEGYHGTKKDMKKAIECSTKGAELGSKAAHFHLGKSYLRGTGVKKDEEKAKYHLGVAAVGGDVDARTMLGKMEMDIAHKTCLKEAGIVNGVPMARAAKHWGIAAKAGCDSSMKMLMTFYSSEGFKKYITKTDLEVTLRAHKEAKDSMTSNQRDIAAQFDDIQLKLWRGQNTGVLTNDDGSFVGTMSDAELDLFKKTNHRG